MSVTIDYGATSYADQSRGSFTLVWDSPANASIGSPVTADAGFLPALGSHWLAGLNFVPTTPIPSGATILSVDLIVRHRATSAGDAPTPVVLSALQAGAFSITPNHSVPSTFENYATPLTGLSVADLNAGISLGRLAYDASVAPVDLNAANYTVSVSPSSPTNYQALGGLTQNQDFTISAIYTGGGVPAPNLLVGLTATAKADGKGHNFPPTATTNYTGTASVSNGLGQSAFGPIAAPSTFPDVPDRTATGSGSRIVFVGIAGPAAVVSMTGTVTVTPGSDQDGVLNYSLSVDSVSPQNYDATTVEVEAIYIEVTYDSDEPPPEPSDAIVSSVVKRLIPTRLTTLSLR